MELRYRCLILDHDDTAVNSTAEIHYPAHLEIMKHLRPDREPISLEGWFLKNFHPGIMGYLVDELGFSERELEREYDVWREYTSSRVPAFFPGFLEVLEDFKAAGGILTVVSHSEEDVIRRHYEVHDSKSACLPDVIFGWTCDEEKRKPSPYPVRAILKRFDLEPGDALILDDLKPGIVMGGRSGVAAAGAGWAHRIPEIQAYMKEHCVAYFTSVSDFREFLFS